MKPAPQAATLTALPTVAPTASHQPASVTPRSTATKESAPATAAASMTPTPDPALAAVLSYLVARAKADVPVATGLACAAWRSQAVTEAISFRSMNATLVDVACTVSGRDGPFTLVSCGGKIVTNYGGETREWDLSTFVYQAANEDGQWKMCGYH